jgi:peroxiredoxin Q/BCP
MLNVGDPAPDFAVPDHTGRMRRLSDFRGKNVVLWFYPKASTPGWTLEGRGFRDHYAEFQAKNAEILGASFDTVEENAEFAREQGFPFPLLCDVKREIGLAYGSADSPTSENASRISYIIGPDGRVTHAYPKVSPKAHPDEVLAALP